MCVIDELMARISKTHDPVDKMARDEIILLNKRLYESNRQIELLAPKAATCDVLLSDFRLSDKSRLCKA